MSKTSFKLVFLSLVLFVIAVNYNACSKFEALSSFSIDPFDFANYKPGPMVKSSFRRLTTNELNQKIKIIFGLSDVHSENDLPEESFTPFNNDIDSQSIQAVYVNSYEYFANNTAQKILDVHLGKSSSILVCQPSSKDDINCFKRILRDFYEKGTSSTMSENESSDLINKIINSMSSESYTERDIIEIVISFVMQTPIFLYLKKGDGVNSNGVYELSPEELAQRIALVLTGSSPGIELINAFKSEAFRSNPETVIGIQVRRLLADPSNADQIVDQLYGYHSMLLRFNTLEKRSIASKEIVQDMVNETKALLKDYLIDRKLEWGSLLRSEGSYMTGRLAKHYSLNAAGLGDDQISWVNYGSTRQGILSHGAVLYAGTSNDHTSPTGRGYNILKSLLCTELGLIPPDVDLNIDKHNGDNNCKEDVYKSIAFKPNCSSCHNQMDKIGFSLENFTADGKIIDSRKALETAPNQNIQCRVSGEGAIHGKSSFTGVKGLSEALEVDVPLQDCVTQKLSQFVFGENLEKVYPAFLGYLKRKSRGMSFQETLITILSSKEFRQKAQ